MPIATGQIVGKAHQAISGHEPSVVGISGRLEVLRYLWFLVLSCGLYDWWQLLYIILHKSF